MAVLRDHSRNNHNSNDWGHPTVQEIAAGSLQRIADACELMARDRDTLERRVKALEESKNYWHRQADHHEHRVRALKGVITKLKRAAVIERTLTKRIDRDSRP